MAGWGRCRNCHSPIWWGTSPFGSGKAFPFDDEDEEQSHFETCAAQEWVTDTWGGRHRVSRCRACGARVWWETTLHGKRRPMDVEGETASWECHFDTCDAQPRSAPRPEPEPKRQQRAADPSVVNAPYAIRLWLPDLELRWPCTLGDVTSSFRRLAMIHHPDMGGSASDFIRIKLAYDRLKHLLGVGVGV